MDDRLWTVAKVAEFLEISEWSVNRLARERKLRCVLLGGRSRRFRHADVMEFVESCVA
ncbi:helix-turn-helix transcriptional regulator [Rhodococcus erythropolis]|uniref:helix-turn-helix transcriptional regulator n=1 Tax=Rhodococcus erythropolis TaxID=1833 RepID=UPI000F74B20C|nr:helix-turn-helix domain-containing protein [Rhodococcus erythropolis]